MMAEMKRPVSSLPEGWSKYNWININLIQPCVCKTSAKKPPLNTSKKKTW